MRVSNSESRSETHSILLTRYSAAAVALVQAIGTTKLSPEVHGDLRFGAVFIGKGGKRLSRVYVADWRLARLEPVW
jgi:hypothetical protein